MKISHLKDQLEISSSINNKKALAEAYINKGEFDKAIQLYESCLEGLHKNDPHIIEGLCCAYFFKSDLEAAKTNLLRLREIRKNENGNNDISDEFDLLLARTYEEQGDIDKALKEYTYLLKRFSGEEARCRYALFLKKYGKTDEAKKIFREILKNARLSPKYYRRRQKKWISIARMEK